jgi:hypothetical protein
VQLVVICEPQRPSSFLSCRLFRSISSFAAPVAHDALLSPCFVRSTDARHQGGTFQYLLSCVITDPVHSVTLLGQLRNPRAHQTQPFKVSFLRSCRSCLLQLFLEILRYIKIVDCPHSISLPLRSSLIWHLQSVLSCGAFRPHFPFLHRSLSASAQVFYCLCTSLVPHTSQLHCALLLKYSPLFQPTPISHVLPQIPYIAVSFLFHCAILCSMTNIATDSAASFFEFWFTLCLFAASIMYAAMFLAVATPAPQVSAAKRFDGFLGDARTEKVENNEESPF